MDEVEHFILVPAKTRTFKIRQMMPMDEIRAALETNLELVTLCNNHDPLV